MVRWRSRPGRGRHVWIWLGIQEGKLGLDKEEEGVVVREGEGNEEDSEFRRREMSATVCVWEAITGELFVGQGSNI